MLLPLLKKLETFASIPQGQNVTRLPAHSWSHHLPSLF